MRNWSRREGLDIDVGACAGVVLFVPTGEGSEKKEGYEGQDNGDDAAMAVSKSVLLV